MEKSNIYRLYTGLNDKDAKRQLIPTEEAYTLFKGLVARKFDGATCWLSEGVYTHENGEQVSEQTIVCELLFTDIVRVKQFANELKRVFNQESIALQIIEAKADLI